MYHPRPVRVNLIHDARLPVSGYGGTERVLWWLGRGLVETGVSITFAVRAGSHCDFAPVHAVDFSRSLAPQLPPADLHHFFFPTRESFSSPSLITIHGNGKAGEIFTENSVFLSRDHAARHNASAYVYNGVDPDELRFSSIKTQQLLFLAKAAWRVKNAKGAIRVAQKAKRPLHLCGGRYSGLWFFRRGVIPEGMVDGEKKKNLLSHSAALLFPVLWHEPFGIAVIESLASGTPVIATPFGSLPELVPPEVGRLCGSETEMVEAIAHLGDFRPSVCRDWAIENFHFRKMALRYLSLYERVIAGKKLNQHVPRTLVPAEVPFPTRPQIR